MPPPATVDTFTRGLEKLIKKFDADKAHYLSKNYVEAQARVDFITPFFKSLGWDVENEAGLPHHEREVIVERGEENYGRRPRGNLPRDGRWKFGEPAISRGRRG